MKDKNNNDAEFGYLLIYNNTDVDFVGNSLEEAEAYLNNEADPEDLEFYEAFKFQRIGIRQGKHQLVDLKFKDEDK